MIAVSLCSFLTNLGMILMSHSVVLRFQLDKRFAHFHSYVIIWFQFKQGMGGGYWISVSSCSILMILGLILIFHRIILRFQLDERSVHFYSSVITLFQFKQGMGRGHWISVSSCSFLMNLGLILMYHSVVIRVQLYKRFAHPCSSVIIRS